MLAFSALTWPNFGMNVRNGFINRPTTRLHVIRAYTHRYVHILMYMLMMRRCDGVVPTKYYLILNVPLLQELCSAATLFTVQARIVARTYNIM